MADSKKLVTIRSQFIAQIRQFFANRNILEVDTPQLRSFSVTDPYMNAMSVSSTTGRSLGFLQTSPEYAMKKLLCDGAGDIYQLSKMFRAEENGPFHLPEFTLLEWYRVNYDHWQLMDEVGELITELLGDLPVRKMDYAWLFNETMGFDIHNISIDSLRTITTKYLGQLPSNLVKDNYLSLLFSECIEPQFDNKTLSFVYHYPASQSSLAKVTQVNGQWVAERFEAYIGNVELANGFHELTNASEQQKRFEEDNQTRRKLGYAPIEIDSPFINSLRRGLPDCAGVALGVDRLLMLKTGATHINEVVLSA